MSKWHWYRLPESGEYAVITPDGGNFTITRTNAVFVDSLVSRFDALQQGGGVQALEQERDRYKAALERIENDYCHEDQSCNTMGRCGCANTAASEALKAPEPAATHAP